jgi:succinyldiaminopimelate transaminase
VADRVWSVSELIASLREEAARSGRRVIDLGQGTPTDPTPAVVQAAAAAATDWPGYPPAHGSASLRDAYSRWAHRRWGAAVDPAQVLATAGSKEFIATLPWLLGLGPGDVVVVPELAYPTYAAGAELAGCRVVAADSLTALGPQRVALLWLNTPGNPTGRVLPEEHLAKVVSWARERKVLVVSDECYAELTPPGPPAPSILAPRVCRGDFTGILAVHSLSKRSTMAGYRIGFACGDPDVVARLLTRRRDVGLLAAGPSQDAARAALDDDVHVRRAQRDYARRRAVLADAVRTSGMAVADSQAGLFLWASAGRSDRDTVRRLAQVGVLAAPGGFYGAAGRSHVRFSLTASDADLADAADRVAHISWHDR